MVRFIHSNAKDEYACFNSYGERAGKIYRQGDKWAFTDEFVGDTDLFDTVDEAKDFFINMEREERERNGE